MNTNEMISSHCHSKAKAKEKIKAPIRITTNPMKNPPTAKPASNTKKPKK